MKPEFRGLMLLRYKATAMPKGPPRFALVTCLFSDRKAMVIDQNGGPHREPVAAQSQSGGFQPVVRASRDVTNQKGAKNMKAPIVSGALINKT
jgi:hypothetical protein